MEKRTTAGRDLSSRKPRLQVAACLMSTVGVELPAQFVEVVAHHRLAARHLAPSTSLVASHEARRRDQELFTSSPPRFRRLMMYLGLMYPALSPTTPDSRWGRATALAKTSHDPVEITFDIPVNDLSGGGKHSIPSTGVLQSAKQGNGNLLALLPTSQTCRSMATWPTGTPAGERSPALPTR